MSIVTVRSWMYEKKGCQILIAAVMLLIMIGFVGPSFMCNRGPETDPNVVAIVEVGGKPATSSDLMQIQDLSRQQNPSQPTTPRDYFNRQAMELAQAIDLAAGDSLAARYGVQPSKEAALKSFEQDLEGQLFSVRFQMQMEKLVKPGATDKEFEEAFKKKYGRDLSEVRESEREKFLARLEDPKAGPLILRAQTVQAVIDHVSLTLTPSEAELKKTYENKSFNRLAFVDNKLTDEQRRAKAEKARAALAGGKKFADVHKEHIGGTVPPPTELPVSTIETNKDYEKLKGLKPNEAVVISEFGQPVVYQYISTRTNLPSDYEKNKANLMKEFAKSKATTQVQEELKEIREDESKFVWKMPHLKVVYDLYKQMTKTPPPSTAGPYMDIIKQIEDIEKGENFGGGDILIVAKHVAFEEAYKNSSASTQIGMKEDRAEYMAAALDIQDNTALRGDLADIYRELKMPDEAADNLARAITNTVTFTEGDVKFVEVIEKKAKSWQKAGFFAEEQMAVIEGALKQWRAEKVQWQKDEAEMKAAEEQARKEQEAERKKLEAENEAERKKLEEEEKKKKAATTGTSGATTSGAPTTTTGTTGAATGGLLTTTTGSAQGTTATTGR